MTEPQYETHRRGPFVEVWEFVGMGEDWKKGPYRHFHRRGVFFRRLTAERFVTWLKART